MTVPPVDRATPSPGHLDRELALAAWRSSNSFAGDRWAPGGLLELKRSTVSVVLPAREVAETIGGVLEALLPHERDGLIDELLVVDAASCDGTASVAEELGVTVLQESDVLPHLGRAEGKGDAMWRGLAATTGDIVVYLDTDTRDFDDRFLLGLLGPLLERPDLGLVKGAFRRPFHADGMAAVPDGGGRVTELVARPLLNLHMPELGGFVQPLAGETAGRRSLLESLEYPVGYGIEIAMLIDVARTVGVEAMAQVDLGSRQNRHQPLRDLSAMAYAVLAAAARRLDGPGTTHGRRGALALPAHGALEMREVPLAERPPVRSLSHRERAAARALVAPRRPPTGAGSARFSGSASR